MIPSAEMEDTEFKLGTIPESDTSGPPSVICVALWRMGTASLAVAFNDLGIRPHHALDILEDLDQWAKLEKAAEATWPAQASGPPRGPFTREEWDGIYGKYGAITEVGAAFAEQLIGAYPEAKVVVVRRDFEKWWPSIKTGAVDVGFDFRSEVMLRLVLPILGNRIMAAMRKILLGFFDASTPAEIEQNARMIYDRHYERIRELVPGDRRLEYTLGDGWEPLCEFLGKEIPEKEFPFVNESKALKIRQDQQVAKFQVDAVNKIKSWIPGSSWLFGR